MTTADVDAGFARMQELLGVGMEVEYCPHAAGPPVCWCRKPLPGLGVLLIERHKLDPSACIYVGAGHADPGFARRLGFEYRSADDFFGPTLGTAIMVVSQHRAVTRPYEECEDHDAREEFSHERDTASGSHRIEATYWP